MLLGFIFIFFIGKYFYTLADNYNKGKWKFAVLGVVSYYGSVILFGLFYGLFYGFFYPEDLDQMNELSVGLISVAVGVFSCVILFQYLDYKWKKEEKKVDEKLIDEIGKHQE